MEVFGRVFILGLVAAADVSTRQAQSQMHPAVADLQTLFTALRRLRLYVMHLVQMRTLYLASLPRHIITPLVGHACSVTTLGITLQA
jgi:hypothetical protein